MTEYLISESLVGLRPLRFDALVLQACLVGLWHVRRAAYWTGTAHIS
jgi:hypothetical protein